MPTDPTIRSQPIPAPAGFTACCVCGATLVHSKHYFQECSLFPTQLRAPGQMTNLRETQPCDAACDHRACSIARLIMISERRANARRPHSKRTQRRLIRVRQIRSPGGWPNCPACGRQAFPEEPSATQSHWGSIDDKLMVCGRETRALSNPWQTVSPECIAWIL